MKSVTKELKELREVRKLVDWARKASEYLFKNPCPKNFSLWKNSMLVLKPFEDYKPK